MKIGINLVGVSYNDGGVGRYRNYEDAIDGFMSNVVTPLKEEGHEISFYLLKYCFIIRAFDKPTISSNSFSVAFFTFNTDLKCFNKSLAVFSPIPLIFSSSFLIIPLLRVDR